MRKQEQKLWDTMKRQLTPSEFWMQRIENVMISGMPDVYVVSDAGRTAWVELKAPTRPKRDSTPLLGKSEGLSVEQINWHIIAARRGLRTYILIRCSLGSVYLVEGKHSANINAMSVVDMTPWTINWEDLRRILK